MPQMPGTNGLLFKSLMTMNCYVASILYFSIKKGSITKLVGFRIPDIFPPAHVK